MKIRIDIVTPPVGMVVAGSIGSPAITRANDLMRVDTGRWAASLDELVSGGHLARAPDRDGWGNVWDYTVEGSGYTLVSHGSDGRPGPAPPADWSGAPYEPDLVLHDGQFTQVPSGR